MDTKPVRASQSAKAGPCEWIGLAILALPCLVYAMDLTVLNLALPALSADLRPSGTELLWIVDVYGFFAAGSLVTMGWLGDRIGRRRLLMIGGAAFAGASILSALATGPTMLIAARALLGIAGGTLAPSTLSLISRMFKDEVQRGRAIAIWVMSYSAGAAIGPLADGVLLERFWWGSVFLLGIPPVAALLVLGPRLLPEYRDPGAGRLDLPSAALSLSAVLASTYGLKQIAQGASPLASIPWIAAGIALGATFVRRQRRLPSPLIDLRLFGIAKLRAALTATLVSFAVVFGIAVFTAQYLQSVVGLSPLAAGLWSLPWAIGIIASSAATERITRHLSREMTITLGLLVGAAGLGVLTQVDGGLTPLVAGSTILSLGMGPVVTLATDLVVSSAPLERAGAAAGVSETSSELGGALGIALLGSVAAAVFRGGLPAGTAGETVGGTVEAGERLGDPGLVDAARDAFTQAVAVTAGIGSIVLLVGAAVMLRVARRERLVLPAEAPSLASAGGCAP